MNATEHFMSKELTHRSRVSLYATTFIRILLNNPHHGLLDSQLEFNVPFQQKYGYIRDERSGVESYPYPVKEG